MKDWNVHVTVTSEFTMTVEADNAEEAGAIAGQRLDGGDPHTMTVKTEIFKGMDNK